ncbi:hypothetical protein DAPPUDRAFT_114157 [Daphnia pulex]|uniref:Uncharacterized protein n=1 Tax=Daphnia pulex TaxID=6669 RepID=E9HH76_DAPPU|nr:hypothetical protein DAPPUDRAFT_114157 [Daphnia pulex]|eukprot:EFX68913.1 hypothetical protein DAPPUDRAFT_114157 [Daphnia pulex]
MAHITIGNVQANQKRRGSPTISLEVLQDDGGVAALLTNVVPDPGAEVSVCGKDIMEAIGLSESHLATSSFDLVMADRSSPLLSIGQRDITVRYGGKSARITVVFCPEISGMLVCRVDCVSLNILHRDYPKPLASINLVMAADVPLPSDDPVAPPSGPFLRGVYIPLEPSAEQISVVEAAIAAEFESVFDQDDGLRQMVGPDMVIQLRDDAVPFYVNGARPIAFGDRAEVKCKLDDLVKKKAHDICGNNQSDES